MTKSDETLAFDMDTYWTHSIELRAHPTGRTEERGDLTLTIHSTDETARTHLSAAHARQLGEKLIEFAGKAEKFSTRGFIGSSE